MRKPLPCLDSLGFSLCKNQEIASGRLSGDSDVISCGCVLYTVGLPYTVRQSHSGSFASKWKHYQYTVQSTVMAVSPAVAGFFVRHVSLGSNQCVYPLLYCTSLCLCLQLLPMPMSTMVSFSCSSTKPSNHLSFRFENKNFKIFSRYLLQY